MTSGNNSAQTMPMIVLNVPATARMIPRGMPIVASSAKLKATTIEMFFFFLNAGTRSSPGVS